MPGPYWGERCDRRRGRFQLGRLGLGGPSNSQLAALTDAERASVAPVTGQWLTLDSVETGLGGGGGETMVNALWSLLLGWAALRARELPRALNYLGLVAGVAGILSVVLAVPALTAVYAFGLIIWLVWLGIVMLRRSPVSVA
jgi:Domain of unknown function (DUF4386)